MLFEIENFSDTIRKRRILFYSHLAKMNNDRPTKQVFAFLRSIKKQKFLKNGVYVLNYWRKGGFKKMLNDYNIRFYKAPKLIKQ